MGHIAVAILTILIFVGCSSHIKEPRHSVGFCKEAIFSLKSSKCITKKRLIRALENYKVIFIGDHHNSMQVHNFTKYIIEELSDRGYKIHLANEWFTPADNKILADLSKREFNEDEFKRAVKWDEYMSLDFSLFSPIYKAVVENGGELYGVNLSKRERKMLGDKDMPSYVKTFYNQLDSTNRAHRDLVMPYLHCYSRKKGESKDECFERNYMIQVGWDSMMAGQSAYLTSRKLVSEKDKLIVFVGAMHLSYGLGVNMRFARMSDEPFVTIMPQKSPVSDLPIGYSDFIFIY